MTDHSIRSHPIGGTWDIDRDMFWASSCNELKQVNIICLPPSLMSPSPHLWFPTALKKFRHHPSALLYRKLSISIESSAFNTIAPSKLTCKLKDLDLNSSLCYWILDFLTGRPQVVRYSYTECSTRLHPEPHSLLCLRTTACPLTAPPLWWDWPMILWFWAS